MRKSVPFSVRVSSPEAPENCRLLAEKVARTHAESLFRALDREVRSPDARAEILDQLLRLLQNQTRL